MVFVGIDGDDQRNAPVLVHPVLDQVTVVRTDSEELYQRWDKSPESCPCGQACVRRLGADRPRRLLRMSDRAAGDVAGRHRRGSGRRSRADRRAGPDAAGRTPRCRCARDRGAPERPGPDGTRGLDAVTIGTLLVSVSTSAFSVLQAVDTLTSSVPMRVTASRPRVPSAACTSFITCVLNGDFVDGCTCDVEDCGGGVAGTPLSAYTQSSTHILFVGSPLLGEVEDGGGSGVSVR